MTKKPPPAPNALVKKAQEAPPEKIAKAPAKAAAPAPRQAGPDDGNTLQVAGGKVPAPAKKAAEAPAKAAEDVPARRGFAAMSPEMQREIASKGGRAAHEKGTAHEFTSEEARRAGRLGGEVVSRDRAHMARIGRSGGLNSHGRNEETAANE